MLRHSEKTLKPAFGKKENVNTDEKLKTNGKSSDLKRNDRGAGTDACSKELAKRKRKATSSVDEESLEEKMNNDSKGSQNNVKKAKPGKHLLVIVASCAFSIVSWGLETLFKVAASSPQLTACVWVR